MELRERTRKVDISNMSDEALDNLSSQIGDKVRQITDNAVEQVNSLLGIYGLSAKMLIKFNKIPKKMEKNLKPPTKKGRKTKQDNLK